MPKTIVHRASAAVIGLSLASSAFGNTLDTPAPPAESERPFIETSHLIAPERVGDFVLEGASYDDKNRYSGAGFRYALPGHQETRFDVFVYPAGRMEQEAAVDHGMVEFMAGIREAQETGHVSDLQLLEESRFALEAAPTTQVPGATKRPPAKGGDLDAALLATIAGMKPVGRRLRMRNTMQPSGTPMRSNGYLFHKNLFFFKVRASAAQERIIEAEFNSITDQAARTLVQAIEVANIGSCANIEITVDPDAGPEAVANLLVKQATAHAGENCFNDKEHADLVRKSKSARVVEIEFTHSDWNTE